METKLAIHKHPGSFSDRWISYCETNHISYKVVKCFDSNIVEQLTSVSGLLWHWNHLVAADVLIARHVLTAAEMIGVAVFPSTRTCWHFDDKIAQKYLLETIGAPLVSTHVFYERESAHQWIETNSFPKVFKLRKGAGSQNVRLVRSRKEAHALVKRAFSTGFRVVPHYWTDYRTHYRSARRRSDLLGVVKRLPDSLRNIGRLNRVMGRETGYLYFQDFIPNNQFDTRVTVIGERAFAYVRKVRPGDFRASGSGNIDYDPKNIRLECVEIAFDIARKTQSQSMAFDFVLTPENRPMIVEVSYCYVADYIHNCPGQWDRELNWHSGPIWPEDAIIADLLETISQRPSNIAVQARGQPTQMSL